MDVGANIGQSAVQFRRAFPEATIHCFEPVRATFSELQSRVAELGGSIFVHQLALGAENGSLQMSLNSDSRVNRIDPQATGPTEMVDVVTGDSFCRSRDINEVSLLKIDAEGHDLECLRGFEEMLASARIDLVQVEASMNPENERHIAFETMKFHFEERGYRLFRLYEQFPEFKTAVLRRCNPVFISPRLAAMPRRAGRRS